MARLEDLIAEVEDKDLRRALAQEVRALKQATTFGLVFERHLPESVWLPATIGVEPGDVVHHRNPMARPGPLTVVGLSGEQAEVEAEDGEKATYPLAELRVVKGFGQPIYPTATSVDRIAGNPNRPWHTVFNGENYHTLQLMLHCWEGQVDCIYIDPPYNTGARDWKYNNDYVDNTDTWHHSKWLSMMEKRLRLAKRLLKPDGVLICTIDEHEVHHLGGLLEQVFSEYLRYMITIVMNPKGTNKVNFGRVDEYAFFVVPDTGAEVIATVPPPADQPEAALTTEAMDPEDASEGPWVRSVEATGEVRLPAGLRQALGLDEEGGHVELSLREDGNAEIIGVSAEEDEDEEAAAVTAAGDGTRTDSLHLRRRGAESSFRAKRWRSFYAIKVNEKTRTVVGIGPQIAKDAPYELGKKEGDILWLYPVDEEGRERVWRYGRKTMADYIKAGVIKVGKHAPQKPQPYTLNHHVLREGEKLQRIRTVWWRKSHDAGTHGTTLISRLLGEGTPFPFPKSLYAVHDCLEAVVKDRKDALIVDFFAGSGTTLHATALLNRDGGRRRCVLATNNEVAEDTAAELNEAGFFAGDPEFEKHGIFEAATWPRCKTALTGVRPDGNPVPRGKKFQYLDGSAWADGFEENCEFFRLDYVNPDEIELGQAFKAIHPLLWLTAGARHERGEGVDSDTPFAIVEEGGYAVLFEEAALRDLITALNEAPAVEHVFLVTDSEDAYAEMCDVLGAGHVPHMLYRDYLRSFRIQPGFAV